MRCLQILAGIALIKQESRNPSVASGSIFCNQRKTQHLRCSLRDAQGSVPPTPAVLGDLGRAVFAAEVELLSKARTRRVFLGEDWKDLCPWIVCGSVWVFLLALRARFHRILRHMCNQKGRPEGVLQRQTLPASQLQQDPNSFPRNCSSFVRATKIVFILASHCPCSSWIKLTLKYTMSSPLTAKSTPNAGKRPCTIEY